MTYMTWGPAEVEPFDMSPVQRRQVPQGVLCAIALILSAPIGLGMLYLRPADAPRSVAELAPPVTVPIAAPALTPALAPLRHYAAVLDPAFVGGASPASFAQDAPLRAYRPKTEPAQVAEVAPPAEPQIASAEVTSAEVANIDGAEPTVVPALPAVPPLVQEIPMPLPRPAFSTPAASPLPRVANRRVASLAPADKGAPAPAAEPGGQPSFFDRLFSLPPTPGSALGYANPETGAIGTPGGVDRYTAVYDITAHTVTLPNGTRLEAHSGLGTSVDDPSSVTQRMRGATPPNLYELTPREALFHGVRALRMTPTGGTTFGRAGLLTHSYMLRGHTGESNGCVVFRDYEAFIAAYDSGLVRRLLVVAHAS